MRLGGDGAVIDWLYNTELVNLAQGLLSSDFVHFGPSPTTMYVGIHLDTWRKWSAVAIFTAISSFMNDFAGESLEPFFLMVLRDHKTRYIPYSKVTSVVLNQAWTLYCSIMSVFGLYTYFSQAFPHPTLCTFRARIAMARSRVTERLQMEGVEQLLHSESVISLSNRFS